MQEAWIRPLDRKDPLEKEIANHSSILTWEISWTGNPGGLQSTWLQESDTTERLHFLYINLIFQAMVSFGFFLDMS